MDSYSERFIVCYLTQWKTNKLKNRSIDQSFIHCTIHIMDSSCCLERDRWQSASHSKGTEILFIIYWLQSFTSSPFRLKIQNKRIMKNSAMLKSMWRSFFDKQVEAMYLHMYAHFVLYIKRVTLILWETIKRLPVLWLIKMWETINTGHHLPVCALISHQTQRSRSQSLYVGRGEPD